MSSPARTPQMDLLSGDASDGPMAEKAKAPTSTARGTAAGVVSQDMFAAFLAEEPAWTVEKVGRVSGFVSAVVGDTVVPDAVGLGGPATGATAGEATRLPATLTAPMATALSVLKPSPRELTVPYVTPVAIRRVRTADFEPYLQHIAPVYDRYLYSRTAGVQNASQGTPVLAPLPEQAQQDKEDEFISSVLRRLCVADSLETRGSPTAPTETSHPRLFSDADRALKLKMLAQNLKPVESIPKVYLGAAFALRQPSCLAEALGHADLTDEFAVVADDSGELPEAALGPRPLQRSVSEWLETAELHLIKEISRQAPRFYGALQTLQSLDEETAACVQDISALRSKLANVSTVNAKQGLEIVRLKQRRKNVSLLHNSVKLIQDLKQTQPMIQVLLGQGDYVGALDLIEEAGRVVRSGADLSLLGAPASNAGTSEAALPGVSASSLASPNSSLRALPQMFADLPPGTQCIVQIKAVRALVHFAGQLQEVAKNVGLLMEADFVHMAMHDVSEAVRLSLEAPGRLSPKFAGTLMEDWVHALTTASPVPRAAPGKQLVLVPHEEEAYLKGHMLPLVTGLIRLDCLAGALHVYREKLRREVNVAVRRHYPTAAVVEAAVAAALPHGRARSQSLTSPPAVNPGGTRAAAPAATLTPLSKYIRNVLTQPAFQQLVSEIGVTLLTLLGRCAAVHYTIAAIVDEAQTRHVEVGGDRASLGLDRSVSTVGGVAASVSGDDDDDGLGIVDLGVGGGRGIAVPLPQPAAPVAPAAARYAAFMAESQQTLVAVADECLVRVAKLLAIRGEQTVALPLADFLPLYNLAAEQSRLSELLCGCALAGTLKGTLLAHTRRFFARFHETKLQQLAQCMEAECWAAANTPTRSQELVDLLCQLGEHDLQWSSVVQRLQPAAPREPVTATEAAAQPSRPLQVGAQTFSVVGTVLVFVELLHEYLVCAQYLSLITSDVVARMLDVLKLFNSRTCQVILGAGALKSAGLKTITSKHIALAAQSLGAVVHLVTLLKDHVRRLLGPRQQAALMADYEKVCRDYVEHQNELFGRLVRLMEDRMALGLAEFARRAWDASSADTPSAFALAIVKDTGTLFRVLGRYLAPAQVTGIFVQIYTVYARRFTEGLAGVTPSSAAGRDRLAAELLGIGRELDALNAGATIGPQLEQLAGGLSSRDIRAAAPPASAASASTPSGGYFSSLFGRGGASAANGRPMSAAAAPDTPRMTPALAAATEATRSVGVLPPAALPLNQSSAEMAVSASQLANAADAGIDLDAILVESWGGDRDELAVPQSLLDRFARTSVVHSRFLASVDAAEPSLPATAAEILAFTEQAVASLQRPASTGPLATASQGFSAPSV